MDPTFNLNVRIDPSSLFNLTAGGCLLRSSPGLSDLVTPADPTCTNLCNHQPRSGLITNCLAKPNIIKDRYN